ncbi:MAG: hypothetical protein F4X74_00645 [Acidimicrobiia bacterium]|nr:hypothetical protein [Acidimicrobiia bacterium]
MTNTPPTPPAPTHRGFRIWTITLLLIILAILTWPAITDWWAESQCTREGGQIQRHNLTGRRLCDFFPYADGIGDMGFNDYWID